MTHMRTLLSFLLFFMVPCLLPAEPAGTKRMEVEAEWPGVTMQVVELKRIPGNRLLFLVRLQASPQAPATTMIGMQRPIPPSAPKEDIEAGLYTPLPYSLLDSVLKDEQSGKTYSAQMPDPKSPAYAPCQTLKSLAQGKFLVMAVEFPSPPEPPLGNDGKPVKQTIALTLPKAKGAIENIALPPADNSAGQ